MRRHMGSSEFLRLVCLSTNRRPCIYGRRLHLRARDTARARRRIIERAEKVYLFDHLVRRLNAAL
jgi:hypothetical protein